MGDTKFPLRWQMPSSVLPRDQMISTIMAHDRQPMICYSCLKVCILTTQVFQGQCRSGHLR